jgi:hypothetical protein
MAVSTTGTAAMVATAKARRILIERHQEEYTELLGDLRQQAGLPRTLSSNKQATLTARITKLQEQLQKLQEEQEKLLS